ncbi:hypothetical protein [Marinitoga lauensis]|uniref:hypothetical protein n=1 Tax=Marinitoga lauensis TaxID=2201189 RepID=UPI001013098F|nr:hypothetical protein [Marinitoga lauensis]
MKKNIVFILFIILIINAFSYVYIENKQLYPGEEVIIHGYNEEYIKVNVYKIIDPMEIFIQQKNIKDLKKEYLYSKKIKLKNNKYNEKIKKKAYICLNYREKKTHIIT